MAVASVPTTDVEGVVLSSGVMYRLGKERLR
jgi:hypothetical protein